MTLSRCVPAARKGKVQNSCWTRTESSISFWTNQSAWTRTESCDPPEGTKSLLTLCSRHPTCTRFRGESQYVLLTSKADPRLPTVSPNRKPLLVYAFL